VISSAEGGVDSAALLTVADCNLLLPRASGFAALLLYCVRELASERVWVPSFFFGSIF
jgi:hypothetical protein